MRWLQVLRTDWKAVAQGIAAVPEFPESEEEVKAILEGCGVVLGLDHVQVAHIWAGVSLLEGKLVVATMSSPYSDH
jgi:hypothetical protein